MGHLQNLIELVVTPYVIHLAIITAFLIYQLRHIVNLIRPRASSTISPTKSLPSEAPSIQLQEPTTTSELTDNPVVAPADHVETPKLPKPKYIIRRFAMPITHTVDNDVKPPAIHLPALQSDHAHHTDLVANQGPNQSTFVNLLLHHHRHHGKLSPSAPSATPPALRIALVANHVLFPNNDFSQPIPHQSLSVLQWLCQSQQLFELYLILHCKTREDETRATQQLLRAKILNTIVRPSHLLICQQEDSIGSYIRHLLPNVVITTNAKDLSSIGVGMIPWMFVIGVDNVHGEPNQSILKKDKNAKENASIQKDITFLENFHDLRHC